MRRRETMGALRIGSVKYLNARPLVEGLGGLVLDTPAGLVDRMRARELDVAMLPVVALFDDPGCAAVRGAGVVARREAKSVLLIHDCPLREIRRVSLDPASRTSAMLLRLILERHEGLRPEYVEEGEPADGRLLIGDRALSWWRQANRERHVDLGAAWCARYGRPFVFAVWVVRQGAPDAAGLAEALREARRKGEARREEYAADELERDYLTRVLSYDVGEDEIASVSLFQSELFGAGLIEQRLEMRWI